MPFLKIAIFKCSKGEPGEREFYHDTVNDAGGVTHLVESAGESSRLGRREVEQQGLVTQLAQGGHVPVGIGVHRVRVNPNSLTCGDWSTQS